MIKEQIKIWIVRLSGEILSEYIGKKVIKDKEAEVAQQNNSKTDSKRQQQQNADSQVTQDLQKYEIVTQLIDNSRKLSLSQYQNELNYVKIKKISYFYRAKYNLLFVCANISNQFTIAAVESILQNVIRLYEQKCLNISNGAKLSNMLSPYQKQQLKKLDQKIKKVVDEEGYFELVRMQSLTDDLADQNNFKEIHARASELNLISARQLKIREQNVRFLHQTQKNVNKYKMKMLCFCFFALLTLFLLLYCFSAYDFSFA